MGILTTIFTTPRLNGLTRGNGIKVSKILAESARLESSAVLENLKTNPNGLSSEEVETRLEQYGFNEVAKEKQRPRSGAFFVRSTLQAAAQTKL